MKIKLGLLSERLQLFFQLVAKKGTLTNYRTRTQSLKRARTRTHCPTQIRMQSRGVFRVGFAGERLRIEDAARLRSYETQECPRCCEERECSRCWEERECSRCWEERECSRGTAGAARSHRRRGGHPYSRHPYRGWWQDHLQTLHSGGVGVRKRHYSNAD